MVFSLVLRFLEIPLPHKGRGYLQVIEEFFDAVEEAFFFRCVGFAAFVQGFAEVGEDVFLCFGEVYRRFDVHGAVEVAGCAAAHGFDAFAF